jgi:hypothetical protein
MTLDVSQAVDLVLANRTWNGTLNAVLILMVLRRVSSALFLFIALGPRQFFAALYKHVLKVCFSLSVRISADFSYYFRFSIQL